MSHEIYNPAPPKKKHSDTKILTHIRKFIHFPTAMILGVFLLLNYLSYLANG